MRHRVHHGLSVPVCSPAHALYNVATSVFGALVTIVAILLFTRLGSALHKVACVLWMVSGASTVAIGLVPSDVDLDLHVLVALPSLLCQPPAMVLHGVASTRLGGARYGALVVLGIGMCAATVAVFLSQDMRWIGLWERLALWPVYLALPVLAMAVTLVRTSTTTRTTAAAGR